MRHWDAGHGLARLRFEIIVVARLELATPARLFRVFPW